MRKIYIFITIFLLLFCYSCKDKTNNKNNNTINVKLNYNIELQDFIVYDQNYEIKQGEEFEFPKLESKVYVVDDISLKEKIVMYTRTIYDFEFFGWETKNNELIETDSVTINENITYTPKYNLTTTSYLMQLHTDGILVNIVNNKDLENFELPIIENPNYTFEGWYHNDSYLGKKIESIKYSQINEDKIIYAKLIPTVEYVNNLIEQLSNDLNIFDIEDIELAYDCYKKLTYENRKLIKNYDKLKFAYQNIDNLKKAYEFYNKLENLYKLDISPNLKYELDKLSASLELLDEDVKKLIPNLDYNKINDISNEVNNLYGQYFEEANEFDKRISKIPVNLEQYYEKEITDIYNEYLSLDENVKSLLNTSDKIETLNENLQKIKDNQYIYYLNTPKTNNIYSSKQQLFESFFTDFYYYIAAYHGLNHLKDNNLNNVQDFVNLAGDFTGAGANNLYGIGNIAGRYMLEKDINGILKNQSENGFFGFCYQNNLYQDLLPFFINFFAFWRIDEKYANSSNYGADIFAESWAPTVDIAKFFYYDETTSYVKTDRMIDCLTNIASVVYNFSNSNSLNDSIKLRGYIFDGWYDNEQFLGNRITDLSQTNSNKLYAKWLIDQNQVDQDSANLVDIYIYNLTTEKAVLNKVTVGYVKEMYDNLSEKGKSLVSNYDTLQELLTKYN